METIAILGVGHMGAGLGWALREGGARVITTLDGRSPRSARFVAEAGLVVLPTLDDVVREAAVLLIVTPPGAARDASTAVREAATRTGGRPLVADLNAIAPSTVDELAGVLAPLRFVDGSISGPPPTVSPGARIYLSGPAAATVAALPWRHAKPIVVGDRIGLASAVKMCTASVYKGLTGLLAQALRTGAAHGVLDHVLTDLTGYDQAAYAIASAATKAARFSAEMREIAITQQSAGLSPALFEAFADLYEEISLTSLAASDPEQVDPEIRPDEVIKGLTR